jgi:tetraacyldisaccharide 4'-kinase
MREAMARARNLVSDRVRRALILRWRGLIEGQAEALTRRTFGPLLTALTAPYALGHRLRLQAYARGWTTVKRLPCRVISVGNLTLGGTGKTPLVEAIAALLQRQGRRVGVLSRGYGRQGSERLVVVSDGQRCLASADIAGDEPVLLAEHLPGVPVVVGKDRYAAGVLAVRRFDLDTVVLDDGFQHLQLARDLDIVTLDAARPFGSGRLFPRGDLRERPSAIRRADAIVLTRWEPDMIVPDLIVSRPASPLFYSRQEPLEVRVCANGQRLPLASLVGQRLAAFCGIGSPERFRRLLVELGASVVAFSAFADHHAYTRSELEGLAYTAKAKGAGALITTEKDGIRLRRLQPLPFAVWELRIRATIVEPQAMWETCILGMPEARKAAGGAA